MRLWSVTTTVRNPERIRCFLQVFKKLEGEYWNDETQKKFQILLIQHKLYGFNNLQFERTLTQELKNWLLSENLTFEQAENILISKNYEGGGEMRGRQSYNPLEKMGLAYLDGENKIQITSFGNSFLRNDYDLGEVFFSSLIKWQYPNPDANKYPARDGYNIKPLTASLHIIDKVNALCKKNGIKEKGVSRLEFALFFTTLSNYKNIEATAEKIITFRHEYEKQKTTLQKNKFEENYFKKHFSEYGTFKNAKEYTDNLIRYFRLTRFFYLRGNDYYIDLEPRRHIEIQALLKTDNASALTFESKLDYSLYLGDMTKPILPWETIEKLQEVIIELLNDIKKIEKELLTKNVLIPKMPKYNEKCVTIDEFKKNIELLRKYRRKIFDAETLAESKQIKTIEKCINSLKNIFELKDKKPVELERLVAIGLNILNDALGINSNYPVGDDNEPTFTAPANKPDIECFYKSFNSICEVTMLTNRSQWFNEGQPVMRHLRDFENAHKEKQSYCLFVAPKIHRDTLNTFWMSVKYEYESRPQKIIPITILQFIEILDIILTKKKQSENFFLTHSKIQELFENIILETKKSTDSNHWISEIPNLIKEWGYSLAA